jgi:hypothetical protein
MYILTVRPQIFSPFFCFYKKPDHGPFAPQHAAHL